MLENESHNITLSSTIEALVLAATLFQSMPLQDLISRSMLLELAIEFGFVTPDPFSSHEWGGVWT